MPDSHGGLVWEAARQKPHCRRLDRYCVEVRACLDGRPAGRGIAKVVHGQHAQRGQHAAHAARARAGLLEGQARHGAGRQAQLQRLCSQQRAPAFAALVARVHAHQARAAAQQRRHRQHLPAALHSAAQASLISLSFVLKSQATLR